jgi:hypothetical protein
MLLQLAGICMQPLGDSLRGIMIPRFDQYVVRGDVSAFMHTAYGTLHVCVVPVLVSN